MGYRLSSSDHYDDQQEHSGLISEINIIPLVDVMLVLLIIFMVAAPLSLSKIDINLPDSSIANNYQKTKKDNNIDPFVLTIDSAGMVFLDDQKIDIGVLGAQIEKKIKDNQANIKDAKLIIRADRQVIYAKVIAAMSAGKQIGVEKISLVMTSEKSSDSN